MKTAHNTSLFHRWVRRTASLGCAVWLLLQPALAEEPAAQLYIQTDPDGATVNLDGADRGLTPLTLTDVAAGEHLLVLTRAGFRTERHGLQLKASDRSAFSRKLEPVKGLVLITSSPPAVSVEIDGALKGETPALFTDLPLASYRLRFSATGYIPQERALEIKDRTPMLITVAMQPSTADYQIGSEPSGARILLDGVERGLTPTLLDRIPAGEHTLELLLEGHQPFKKLLLVQAGVPDNQMALLDPILSHLRIVSLPPGARVYVDNQFKGESPLDISDLPPGSYRVRAELEGFEPLARTVGLELGQERSEEFRLPSISGTLEIVTEPADVRVLINGKPAGITQASGSEATTLAASAPLTIPRLAEGSYTVDLQREGFHPKSLRITIKRNAVARAQETLQKMFIPDYRIVTDKGEEFTGVFVEIDDTRTLKLEVRPGIIRSFAPGTLRRSSRIAKPSPSPAP